MRTIPKSTWKFSITIHAEEFMGMPGKYASLVLVSFLLPIASGCAAEAEEATLSDVDRRTITEEVTEAVNSWIAAASTLNQDSTFGVWSESRDAVIANEGVVLAPPAYRTIWAQTVQGLSEQNFGSVETSVNVISSNVAVSTSTTSAYWVENAAGERSSSAPMALTAVWVRENDQWRVVNAHQSFLGYLPTLAAAQ
jgi:hypothetical protein